LRFDIVGKKKSVMAALVAAIHFPEADGLR
jgi:hypothetical protein